MFAGRGVSVVCVAALLDDRWWLVGGGWSMVAGRGVAGRWWLVDDGWSGLKYCLLTCDVVVRGAFASVMCAVVRVSFGAVWWMMRRCRASLGAAW